MKKKVLSLLLVSVMTAAALTGCGGEKEAETQQAAEDAAAAEEETADEDAAAEDTAAEDTASDGKTFTVGFDAEYPPYGYMDDNGEYTGFDLELAQAVCDLEGWELVKKPINWDSKDMELNSGSIDCIWNGFTMNGREDNYTWSEPYMDNSQIFVVAPDSGIKTLADLADKVVEVQVDSSAQAALAEMPELADTFKDLVVTPDYNTAFMDLEQGAVDAIAMDVTVAGYMIQERQSDFVILDEAIASEVYAIGFKKGNTELRDKVQGALEEMAADGTLTAVSEKWFGKDVTTVTK